MLRNSLTSSIALAVCAAGLVACNSGGDKDKAGTSTAKSMAGSSPASAAASDSKAKPAGPLKPAPSGTWTGYYKNKLHLSAAPGSEIWFYLSSIRNDAPWTFIITAKKLPSGSRIVVGDKSLVVSGKGGYFHYDVSAKAGALPLSSVYHKRAYKKKRADLNIALEVHLPGYKPFVGKLPTVDPADTVARQLRDVPDEGIKFAGEPADDGKRDTIAMAPRYGGTYIFGKGKKIWDIDLVVVPSAIATDRKITCRFTRGTATLSLRDAKVTLYDRRSGKKLTEATIKHSGRCPYVATVKRDNTGTNGVSSRAIRAWARKALAKYRN